VPRQNLREEIGGVVMLLHGLDAQGMPDNIRVGRSAGTTPAHQRLDMAAIQHLRTCRFVPETVHPLPKGSTWGRQYVFRVE
jgi:TonB family protein